MTDKFMIRFAQLQGEMKVPKDRKTEPGRPGSSYRSYSYRSCEDIYEHIKPLCAKYGILINVTDEVAQIGERYYIKATAKAIDTESGEEISATAYAREPDKTGQMNESQTTGAASSYARKYALGGLLALDDNKDMDDAEAQGTPKQTNTNRNQTLSSQNRATASQKAPQQTMPDHSAPSGGFVCADCGKPFVDVEFNGVTMTAAECYANAAQRSDDHVARCKDCRAKHNEKKGKE